MKPWILLSAALLGVSLTPAETALAKGYDAYSLLDSARGVMGGYKAPAPEKRTYLNVAYPRWDTASIKNFRIQYREPSSSCCLDDKYETITTYDKFGGIHDKNVRLTAARRRYWNESYIQGTAYTRTPEYQLEQLKKQTEENQQKLEEMIKNSKFRANGEVNGKPAYYNPVTRQSLTADSDGKYKLRDW